MTVIDLPADFEARHLGPAEADISSMLEELGYESLAGLVNETIPESTKVIKTD